MTFGGESADLGGLGGSTKKQYRRKGWGGGGGAGELAAQYPLTLP